MTDEEIYVMAMQGMLDLLSANQFIELLKRIYGIPNDKGIKDVGVDISYLKYLYSVEGYTSKDNGYQHYTVGIDTNFYEIDSYIFGHTKYIAETFVGSHLEYYDFATPTEYVVFDY